MLMWNMAGGIGKLECMCDHRIFHQNKNGLGEKPKPLIFLVGHVGIEPTTNGLRVRCSTN
jgi:hypothetical protein